MTASTRSLTVLFVALIAALAWLAFGATIGPATDRLPNDEAAGATGIEGVSVPPAETASASPGSDRLSDVESGTAGTPHGLTLAGNVLWANGEPAVGCLVHIELPDHSSLRTPSDASGNFVVPLPPRSSDIDELQISVRPPCWHSEHVGRYETQRDGNAFRVSAITLPDVVDIALDISVPVDLVPKLEHLGIETVDFKLTEATGHALPLLLRRRTLASGAVPLAPQQRQTLRIPYEPLITGFLGFSASNLIPTSALSGGDRGHIAAVEELLEPSRERVAVLRLDLQKCRPIFGVVVDHWNRPLADANAEARTPRSDLPGGFARQGIQLDTRGQFVFFHGGDTPLTLAAAHLGKEATMEVTAGDDGVRLVVDLTDRMPLRVVHGSRPVESFRASNTSRMFAQPRIPPLPWHPDGHGWLPRAQMASGDWLTLGWEHEGQHFETSVPCPPADPAGVVTIDVASLDATPLGSLRIDCGSYNGAFELEREEPTPPTRLCRLGRLMASSAEPIQLYGIRPGVYRVTFRPTGAPPGTRVRSSPFECVPGANAIALDDLR